MAAVIDTFSFTTGADHNEVRCAPDFIALLARTTLLNQQRQISYNISFRSLIAGFLISDDQYSLWFQQALRLMDVEVNRILDASNIDPEMLATIKSMGTSVPPPPPVIMASINAFIWIKTAVDQSQDPSALIGNEHLLRAFVNVPLPHRDEFQSLGMNLPELSAQFARDFPLVPDAVKPAPEVPKSAPPPAPANEAAFSQHIESDVATTVDQLNYGLYREAIRSFIRAGNTHYPLSISIQAPWGGGKSSLMRMLRDSLDPKYRNTSPLDIFRKKCEEERQTEHLTVGQAVKTVEEFKKTGAIVDPDKKPIEQPASSAFSITVWFNAWKYEDSSQVWAGLVDAIIAEVADRMKPLAREQFFLKLNLRRIDPDKVRDTIYGEVFSRWLKAAGVAWTTLATAVGAGLGAFVTPLIHEGAPAVGLIGGGVVSGAAVFWATLFTKRKQLDSEKAKITLHDLVAVPNYNEKLGFIHDVEHDLRNVLETIPKDFWPLVVFVDDLDRCSPQTVSKVMEGINLFLAGDFPDFVFILGMDSELVAAALDSAHKDILACVAADARIPLGWRFMDKFVQLPFVIPSVDSQVYDTYLSLLLTRGHQSGNGSRTAAQAQDAGTSGDGTSSTVAARAFANPSDEFARVQAETQQRLQQTVATFNESDQRVRQAIEPLLPYFGRNPRDLKRFLNALRLHAYLSSPMERANAGRLSLDQVVAWTLLVVKWPDVVRWIRRGDMHKSVHRDNTDHRIVQLETAATAATLTEWKRTLVKTSGLPNGTPWLHDRDLYGFLQSIVAKDTSERLSAGIGKGLW